MFFSLAITSGPFVPLVTISKAFIGIMVTGYTESKRLCAVSQIPCLTGTKIAIARIFRIRLIAWGSASAGSMATIWLESIEAAATYFTVLSGSFAARW